MTWVWTFFNNYNNHPRMCVLSTLCGNVDKHSPFDIYIYIYIYIYIHICVCVRESVQWTIFPRPLWPPVPMPPFSYNPRTLGKHECEQMTVGHEKQWTSCVEYRSRGKHVLVWWGGEPLYGSGYIAWNRCNIGCPPGRHLKLKSFQWVSARKT